MKGSQLNSGVGGGAPPSQLEPSSPSSEHSSLGSFIKGPSAPSHLLQRPRAPPGTGSWR